MKLTPPKQKVFWLSAVLVVLGLLGWYLDIPYVTEYNYHLVLAGYVLLFLGNTMKGL